MAKRMGDANVWVRIFEVTEPTRHRRGFTVYKVVSTVFPKSFPESATKITVWKRYSDFKKLHKELEQIFKQLYLKGEFPEFPKAKVFGRFEHEVVEERRKAALLLLEFTANHLQLFTSKAFIQFFENGYSTQDFMGKILFGKSDITEPEPPVTVLEEKSEIDSPCLKPEVVWNTKSDSSTNQEQEDVEGGVSLSLSSVSSSLSPDKPELPVLNGDLNTIPCSSSTSDLVEPVEVTDTSLPCVMTETSHQLSGAGGRSSGDSNNESSQSVGVGVNSATTSKMNLTHRGNGIVRSATVTDDLSSYFDEEFEDAAFLFPTGSCSSLDTLPGFTPTECGGASEHKVESFTGRGIFSLPRRKPNGFGLFDFLPLFPKKSKKKSERPKEDVKEKEKKDSLSVGYICEAAGHFAVAQFHESNMDFQDSFLSYKEGIRVLLAGAQSDTDRDRKLLAKNKLEKYLTRAESLKETYLNTGTSGGCNGAISPVFSSPNKKEKCLSSLSKRNKLGLHAGNGVPVVSRLEELKVYKVVGVGPNNSKILIVMNPDEASPKCYAAKVVWKSSSIIYPDKPNVMPGFIPFMVKLQKWFETPDKVIFLLEHAAGGRLVDFVLNYQSKRISFVTPPDESTPVEEIIPEIGTFNEQLPPENAQDTGKNEEDAGSSPESQFPRVNGEDKNATSHPGHSENEGDYLLNDHLNNNSSMQLNEDESATKSATSTEENATADELGIEIDNPNPTQETLEVSKLLENSKALLQTVSRTLQEGRDSVSNQKQGETHQSESNSATAKKDEIESLKNCSIQSEKLLDPQTSDSVSADVGAGGGPVEGDTSILRSDTTEEEIAGSFTPKRMVPEGCIRVWAAEIVLSLEALHEVGITYGNLHINDILLGENGHILLRYKCLCNEIDDPLIFNPYTAPEVRDSIGFPVWKIHSSADWWSVGAILFWLLTGQTFLSAHPEGIFPEMVIKIPASGVNGTSLSKSAQTLLSELLQHTPEIRLGYYGAAEIKTHPFFEGFDWEKAAEDCTGEE